MTARKAFVGHIERVAPRLIAAVAAARAWHKAAAGQASSQFEQTLAQINSNHQGALSRIRNDLKGIQDECGLSAAPWDDPVWSGFAPQLSAVPPSVARIGTIEIHGPSARLEAPAMVPVLGSGNVLIKARGAAKTAAAHALQSVALRLLATVPPARLRFLFIDPIGLGQNAAGFMELGDFMEELVGRMALSEANRIEQELVNVTDHMAMVIQKYLRNQYLTIEDYNAEAGEVAEPYRVLVTFNFPVNFTEQSARRLVSIAENGPRCGVCVLATVDPEQKLPFGFNPGDLERTATIIEHDGQRFRRPDEPFPGQHLELDMPPPPELFKHIVTAVGEEAKEASRVEVPFELIAPPSERWWKGDTREGIVVPIGRSGAKDLLRLDLGQGTAQHALLAGRTASGKSTLLHVLITNLALTYPPEELELYLVDFKKGVEFKDYAFYHLPHARVVAIETDREFGLSVLIRLDEELQRRGDLLREAGCENVRQYREKTSGSLARILLVIDEFHEFFVENDALSNQARVLLDRMARQGRAFGIHLLLASQTLHSVHSIARSTIEQMVVRIALQSSEDDSRFILSDDNPTAQLLSRPGEAIYNSAGGLLEANRLFQVAWLPDQQKERLLEQIGEAAETYGRTFPEAIVFEGNERANPEKNQPLRELLDSSTWPERRPAIRAWLGDPVAIREPTAATLRRQAESNLLVVGRDEEAGLGMLLTAILSIAAQQAPQYARFYVLDLSASDAPWARLFQTLADSLPHTIEVRERRNLVSVMEDLANLVQHRLDSENTDDSSVYLVIWGLHRARDLRQDLLLAHPGVYEQASQSAAQRFATILVDGPEVGVHVLAWCDTASNLGRIVERGTLGAFGMRVALPMSSEDSFKLLNDQAAAKLGPNRALYLDEGSSEHWEKFRPYGIPSARWLEEAGDKLKRRPSV